MKKSHKKFITFISWICFIVYLVFMVYFLFFCEGLGRVPSENYHYNIEPFTEIKRYTGNVSKIGLLHVLLNLFGNVVCFIPYGFVLPVLSNRRLGFFKVTIICMLSSMCIELTQLVTKVGSCDVDDVILNTLGGIIGVICFYICHGIYKRSGRKK